MIQDLKNELAILLAKTGLFFAKCDNDYAESESSFIKNFLTGLLKENVISGNTNNIIQDIEKKHLTIEMIIEDTLAMIKKLKVEEREPFLTSISSFIEQVIMADNIIHPKEKENYDLWKDKMYNSDIL